MLKEFKETKVNFSPMLAIIFACYVAMMLTSNIIANRMMDMTATTFNLFSWTSSGGLLTFPLIFVFSNILQEVYGYRWSRRCANTALVLNATMLVFILIVMQTPAPVWFNETYFANALSLSVRIFIGGVVAFYISKLLNDRIFEHIRRKQGSLHKKGNDRNKGFTFRAHASSFPAHILDTAIFASIAFLGAMPIDQVLIMIPIGAFSKWAIEWIIHPLTVLVVKRVRHYEDEWAAELK